jgi:hypothetical protein
MRRATLGGPQEEYTMTDIRQDRSDEFKEPLEERGNPHGGHGRRAERDMSEQFETQTGHPLGAGSSSAGGEERLPSDMPGDTDLTHAQHSRRGQAQSPRELNLNQPEKKKEGR